MAADLKEQELMLDHERPIYECPSCHEMAMQFFHTDPNQLNREDAFVCRNCGKSWEM